jgi:hypothetical protein
MGVEQIKNIFIIAFKNMGAWPSAYTRPGTKQPKRGTDYVVTT